MKLQLIVSVASMAAVAVLSELLEDNDCAIETFQITGDGAEFDFYTGGADTDAPQPPAAAPAGAPTPPTATAPAPPAAEAPKRARRTKAQIAADEAAAANQAAEDAAIPAGLQAIAGMTAGAPAPQPPAAAPAPPSAPAAPAPPPAASPAPAASVALVDPAAYVAPAAVTLEVLMQAMSNLLASGKSATQAQQFLLDVTGHKALKDLPVEWYPRAHWALATGIVPA